LGDADGRSRLDIDEVLVPFCPDGDEREFHGA
jgi:hypothetical protein